MSTKSAVLSLPERSEAAQRASKSVWNDGRGVESADFFTVGYGGQTLEALVQKLLHAGVVSLVDIRHNAVSMYRPEVSKSNLQRTMDRHGIRYLHARRLGVPREVRALAVGADSRDRIWDWYDENVVPVFAGRNLHWFYNALEHRVAFMCSEFDPRDCHRHRLAGGLEERGLMGYEL